MPGARIACLLGLILLWGVDWLPGAWAAGSAAQHLAAGQKAFKARDAAGALIHYKEAVRLAPGSHQAWAHLGTAYGALKQHDLAVAALSAALALGPPSNPVLGPYYGARGLACLDAGRWGQALKDLTRARSLDPGQGRWARLAKVAQGKLAAQGEGPPLPPGWDLPPGWARREGAKGGGNELFGPCLRGWQACVAACEQADKERTRACRQACQAGARICQEKASR